jgi:hypothetical protein
MVADFNRSTSMETKSPTRLTTSFSQRTSVRLLDSDLMVEPLTKTPVRRRLARLAERRARILRIWYERIYKKATKLGFAL